LKRIVLTGGGTAGHVTPNMAIIPELKAQGWDIHYIGTQSGIEKKLISNIEGIKYHSVNSGKLRRYIDIKNLIDPFKVMIGVAQSVNLIRKLKPHIIFSKGGFVSVPVVLGGWINRVPVIVHESDITPGLANKIATKFARTVCTTFPETVEYFPEGKAVYTGTPIRKELFRGKPEIGKNICKFTSDKPSILIMGGSLGAVAINKSIRNLLKKLNAHFNVIHICGRNNVDHSLDLVEGYAQFEYVGEELPHLLALSQLVISRAGANSIYEFLALKKPNLLIPLPLNASRGDQILNARSFEKQGFSKVLPQEELTEDALYLGILDLFYKKDQYIETMTSYNATDSLNKILNLIHENAKF
jgi:UDP-N-acetylglucosamine--N-acetylmuramyl-(pentapeptide) pyrophosphoryl-undecaprenol N-acetylglucosamine transferase